MIFLCGAQQNKDNSVGLASNHPTGKVPLRPVQSLDGSLPRREQLVLAVDDKTAHLSSNQKANTLIKE